MNGLKLIREKFETLFKKPERLLSVEIIDNWINLVVFQAFPELGKIKIKKVLRVENDLKNRAKTFETTKKLLKKIGSLSQYKILLNLDPQCAVTMQGVAILPRQAPQDPIDEAELENLLGQGIWKIYDRERSRAAEKLKTRDLEVFLADAKLKKLRIDGHRVANPLGFSAKTVGLELAQTFTSREFFSGLKTCLPFDQVAVIQEVGPSFRAGLERPQEDTRRLLLSILHNRTDIFFSDHTSFTYRDTFEWGGGNIVRAMTDSLAIPEDVAEKIYAGYERGEGSGHWLKKMENLISAELQLMINGVKSHVEETKAEAVYIPTLSKLPNLLWSARFASRAKLETKMENLNYETILNQLRCKVEWRGERDRLGPALMGVMEVYDAASNVWANGILRRHAHWRATAV